MSSSERSPGWETEDRTQFSYFMYKDLGESTLPTTRAAEETHILNKNKPPIEYKDEEIYIT